MGPEEQQWQGLPRQSSDQDSTLPVQGARAQSVARELDPTCHNQDPEQSNK